MPPRQYACSCGGRVVKPSWEPTSSAPAASPSLDYEFFKTKVQAVFLAKREGHARCVVCHSFNNAPFKLVSLSPGARPGTKSSSRRNFELIKRWQCGLLGEPTAQTSRSPKRLVVITSRRCQQFKLQAGSALVDAESVREWERSGGICYRRLGCYVPLLLSHHETLSASTNADPAWS